MANPISESLRDPFVELLTERAEEMVVEITELRAEVARLKLENWRLRHGTYGIPRAGVDIP